MKKEIGLQEAFDRLWKEYGELAAAFHSVTSVIFGILKGAEIAHAEGIISLLEAQARLIGQTRDKVGGDAEPNPHLIAIAEYLRAVERGNGTPFRVVDGDKQER
ncbi:hypothetical protein [Pedomonas sp. V897]|uniref:hypothetical protein n=1 Tax=Pedomonas sp. V897 TaxID=3446482 RepID=UPI003EE3D149